MVDEVQTGIGRTGTLLASSTFDIDAEVVTLAKGIAGGVPMYTIAVDIEDLELVNTAGIYS